MTQDWRQRIQSAIDDSGKSYREVSLAAGLGQNFVSEMLRTGKEPGADKLAKVAKVLDLSITYVLVGVEMGSEEEEFLRILASLPQEERQALLAMLRARKHHAP